MRQFIAIILLLLLAGCATRDQRPSPLDTTPIAPSPTVTIEASPTAPVVPDSRRIGIRLVGDAPEFFDRVTGVRFIPIGSNFLFLGSEKGYYVDRLFSPDHFDAGQIRTEMQAMRAFGYNVIRTLLDVCGEDCIGARGGGLRGEYLDNVVEFLRLAKEQDLQVILTTNDLPLFGGYVPRVEATCCDPFDGYMNSHYLSPVGVDQWTRYWQDIIHALIERDAPLDVVMAYQIRNELFLFLDKPPLSLTEGLVATANGKSYDMADPAQKEAMIAEGVVYWVDTVSAAIRELDPTALVVVGMFPPNEPNVWRPGDARFVPPVSVFAGSSADILDLHPYSGYIPLAQMMENFQVDGFADKPWVMGEFGGFKFVYGSPQAAASGVQEWQVESCQYGAQGWMFWHWTGSGDHEVWTGSEGEQAIRKVLAPANRPDPCQAIAFDFLETNLALGKAVTASRSLPEGNPDLAVDGWRSTSWQSGDGPVQWVEIDLGQPSTIERLLLVPGQYPDGETTHQVWVSGADHSLKLLVELTAFTRDGEELEYVSQEALSNIRFVRIVTTSSPSWVSWREIEIIGTLP